MQSMVAFISASRCIPCCDFSRYKLTYNFFPIDKWCIIYVYEMKWRIHFWPWNEEKFKSGRSSEGIKKRKGRKKTVRWQPTPNRGSLVSVLYIIIYTSKSIYSSSFRPSQRSFRKMPFKKMFHSFFNYYILLLLQFIVGPFHSLIHCVHLWSRSFACDWLHSRLWVFSACSCVCVWKSKCLCSSYIQCRMHCIHSIHTSECEADGWETRIGWSFFSVRYSKYNGWRSGRKKNTQPKVLNNEFIESLLTHAWLCINMYAPISFLMSSWIFIGHCSMGYL